MSMIDKINRFSPYAVDGGHDAYGDMEPDEFGDYVNFEDYVTQIDQMEAALIAADELAKVMYLISVMDQGAGGRMTPHDIGLYALRESRLALAAYRAATGGDT